MKDQNTKNSEGIYSISEVSSRMGLAPHVLRYYEKEGLLPEIVRTSSGIRRYTEKDLEWLGLICCLKNTGMSLRQVKRFVDLSGRGEKTLKQRCELLSDHQKKVKAHMEETEKHLQKVSRKLEHFTEQYQEYLKKKELPEVT